jgi:hypothetical protein
VNRLDQLLARSRREIEAHTYDVINTETSRYFILEAAHLLAALRLWSQSLYRSDEVIQEVLEAGDVTALRDVSAQLRGMGGRDAKTAVRQWRRWPCCRLHSFRRSRPMPSEPCDGGGHHR